MSTTTIYRLTGAAIDDLRRTLLDDVLDERSADYLSRHPEEIESYVEDVDINHDARTGHLEVRGQHTRTGNPWTTSFGPDELEVDQVMSEMTGIIAAIDGGKRDRLRAVNAELLAALHAVGDLIEPWASSCDYRAEGDIREAMSVIKRAIAKGED